MVGLSGSNPYRLRDGERAGDSADKRNGHALLREHCRAATAVIVPRDFLVGRKLHEFRDPAVGIVFNAFEVLGGIERGVENVEAHLSVFGGSRPQTRIDHVFESG